MTEIKITLNITTEETLSNLPSILSESKFIEEFIHNLIKNRDIIISAQSIKTDVKMNPVPGRMETVKEFLEKQIEYTVEVIDKN
jgi:hypothetical protein